MESADTGVWAWGCHKCRTVDRLPPSLHHFAALSVRVGEAPATFCGHFGDLSLFLKRSENAERVQTVHLSEKTMERFVLSQTKQWNLFSFSTENKTKNKTEDRNRTIPFFYISRQYN